MRSRKELNIIYAVVGLISFGIILTVLFFHFNQNKFNRYEDPQKRFSILYPEDWSVQENSNPEVAVLFSSPKESEMDIFSDNVNIVVQDLRKNPVQIDEYTAIAINQMNVVFGEDVRVLVSEPARLSGRSGYNYEFVTNSIGGELRFKIVWTVVGLTAYQVTFSSQPANFDLYLGKINKMIKSFKIK